MTAQLEELLAALREVLAENLHAAYLHGSSVLGGLRPASDLDVLVVVNRSLAHAERGELLGRIRPLSGPRAGARSLEVTVVVLGDVRPWRYPPVCDFRYGDWLVDEFERSGPPGPAPEPNLAIEVSQARASGRALIGPAPQEVFDPVPAADLARAGTDGVDALLADLEHDTRNVLLTLARIWCTLQTGEIVAKVAAAAWAAVRLPAGPGRVLRHARRLYLTATYAEETWPPGLRDDAPTCADHLVRRIRAGEAAPGTA